MMGIGVDIERTERFAHFQKDSKDPFLRRVFTTGELAYCFGEANPAEHLAGRFAAKEAAIKALGNFSSDIPSYGEIEVRRNEKGVPTLSLEQSPSPLLDIQVSISHTSEITVAFVVVTD